MYNLNLDQKVRGKRMLETKVMKDIELAFRQFGYEGEDVGSKSVLQKSTLETGRRIE
jgi:hypothetical protein